MKSGEAADWGAIIQADVGCEVRFRALEIGANWRGGPGLQGSCRSEMIVMRVRKEYAHHLAAGRRENSLDMHFIVVRPRIENGEAVLFWKKIGICAVVGHRCRIGCDNPADAPADVQRPMTRRFRFGQHHHERTAIALGLGEKAVQKGHALFASLLDEREVGTAEH